MTTINITTTYYSSTPINTPLSPSICQLSISPVDEMDVVKITESFSNKYLSGYDEIHIVIVKEVKSEVAYWLI